VSLSEFDYPFCTLELGGFSVVSPLESVVFIWTASLRLAALVLVAPPGTWALRFLQVGGACYVFIYFMSIGNHVRTAVLRHISFGFVFAAVVACTFLYLQSYRTLAEWEFGWGGTSVTM